MGKLIEKEGRYFKECNIVMLPTKDNSIICTDNGLLVEEIATKSMPYLHIYNQKPQHLYITSDDEIKEGDWWIYKNKNLGQKTAKSNTNYESLEDFKKIIATTDKSLTVEFNGTSTTKGWGKSYLPQPSHKFIKVYCEQGGIDKILVEYEELFKYYPKTKVGYQLKTDSHNTITIKSVKDSWTREEVEKLLHNYSLSNVIEQDLTTEDWIKENL